jgi:hypothetical protein
MLFAQNATRIRLISTWAEIALAAKLFEESLHCFINVNGSLEVAPDTL